MTAANAKAIQDVWARTVDRAKHLSISTRLYRALEKAVPVAWEDGAFVVGFQAMDGQMAGVLNTGEHQMTVERALREVSQDSNLRLRVIEGSTNADWEHTKQRDAAAQANRQQAVQKQAVESGAFSSWDDIYDRVSRLWATAEYRNLSTGRGRYLDSALDIVSEAMDDLYPAEGKADESTERGLSRVIERVASMSSSDPALLSYLLFQRRK
jgi:hypothetical protein